MLLVVGVILAVDTPSLEFQLHWKSSLARFLMFSSKLDTKIRRRRIPPDVVSPGRFWEARTTMCFKFEINVQKLVLSKTWGSQNVNCLALSWVVFFLCELIHETAKNPKRTRGVEDMRTLHHCKRATPSVHCFVSGGLAWHFQAVNCPQ